MERDEDTGRSPVDVFDETAFEQLVGLCSDIRSLWTAATPTEVDRKQILRTMIKDVRIEYRSEDIVRARIVWADDAPTTLVEACRTRNGEAKRLIRRMTTQGLSPAEIADRLNDLGLLTHHGNTWTELTVRQKLRRFGRDV